MSNNFNEQKEKKLLTEDILNGINYSKEKLDMTLSEIGIRLASERNLQKLSVAQAAIRCGDVDLIFQTFIGWKAEIMFFYQLFFSMCTH